MKCFVYVFLTFITCVSCSPFFSEKSIEKKRCNCSNIKLERVRSHDVELIIYKELMEENGLVYNKFKLDYKKITVPYSGYFRFEDNRLFYKERKGNEEQIFINFNGSEGEQTEVNTNTLLLKDAKIKFLNKNEKGWYSYKINQKRIASDQIMLKEIRINLITEDFVMFLETHDGPVTCVTSNSVKL